MKMPSKYAVVLLAIFLLAEVQSTPEKSSRARINGVEQIGYFGYPLEVHHATTTDGYILELHRIPHGIDDHANSTSTKPVVFIMHGIFCTSGIYVINDRDKNLPFIFADLGYDVWMGNGRGTPWSRTHQSLNPDSFEYWNFTLTELSVNDLTTFTDYVLNTTGRPDMFYIGHSQGGLVLLAFLAERPEYQNKIRLATLLAPVTYMSHFPAFVLRVTIGICRTFQPLLRALRIYKLGGNLSTLTAIQKTVPLVYEFGYFVLFGGADSKIFDWTLFPAIAPVLGGYSSVKALVHYEQLHRTKRFGYYDYGKLGNFKEYRRSTPPDYKIENIRTPLAIFYSRHDQLVSPKDLLRAANQLPNLILLKEMPYKKYSHLDFVWSKTVKEDVYDKIVDLIKSKESPN